MQQGMKAQGQHAPPERKKMPRPTNQANPPTLVVGAEMDQIVVAERLSKK